MVQSMAFNAAAGLQGMLKEGSRHLSQDGDGGSGNASVVLSNIRACLQLTRMLSSSLGPQGRCKLVVNHLDKCIVTADCAAILKEVQLEHPVVHLLASACQKQEEECGDNTNTVLAVAGELLQQTANLIQKMTWQTAPEILAGYKRAITAIETEYLPALIARTVHLTADDKDAVLQDMNLILGPVLASKQAESQHILAPLLAQACWHVRDPVTGKIPVEAIRTVKLLGASVTQSKVLAGYVAQRGLETVVTGAENCKVAVFASGVEASSTEAKGTVLMKTAHDLLSYNKTEEETMHNTIQSMHAAGVKVVVTGGNLSDMALHYLDKYEMIALRLGSKWELRRLCQAVGATALVRLGVPTPDEMGFCTRIQQEEVSGRTITVLENDDSSSSSSSKKLVTILLRASTTQVLNDLERAVDDGVQAVAQAAKEPSAALLYGGGAVEMALAVRLQQEASQVPGLEQYALAAAGKALEESLPRTLAENAGWNAVRVLADWKAIHSSSVLSVKKDNTAATTPCDVGIDTEGFDAIRDTRTATAASSTPTPLYPAGLTSMKERAVYDLYSTKLSAYKLAFDTVITILKIDQIIMSKPAGMGGAR